MRQMLVAACIAVGLVGTLSSPSLAQTKSKQLVTSGGAGQCSDTGRFQLFQGEYTTYDLKRKETNVTQAVFLLDSRTGEVKRYINKIDENGRYIETWLPTDLSASEIRRTAQEGK